MRASDDACQHGFQFFANQSGAWRASRQRMTALLLAAATANLRGRSGGRRNCNNSGQHQHEERHVLEQRQPEVHHPTYVR